MYRAEYPRPDFERENWLCLNGEWQFNFDDDNNGHKMHWEKPGNAFEKTIQVPFPFQAKLSGIGDTSFHDNVWYRRSFTLPETWNLEGKKIYINFGAVDYYCKVFVNGQLLKEHEGGHVPFKIDVTDWLINGENDLCIYVNDPSECEEIPRGKQDWLEKSHAIWYTRTTGIWQSVWLELVDYFEVSKIKITPDLDNSLAILEIDTPNLSNSLEANITIYFGEELVVQNRFKINDHSTKVAYNVMGNKINNLCYHEYGRTWFPESPSLFDVYIETYSDGKPRDKVHTYFGMRKINWIDGKVYLNNRPYYQKLVLDQGYWKDGILTAPKDEDYIFDIDMAKKMGFNGCRKHQKVEDPRFLYWADKMGFIVWGEIPSCPIYSDNAVKRLTNEFIAEIERDYNHPCITTWVPFNESWGVPYINHDKKQQSHSQSLYYLIKAIDDTRFVISNDGWEMTVTDVCCLHNYSHGRPEETDVYEQFTKRLSNRENLLKQSDYSRLSYALGFESHGEPIILSECGGISLKDKNGQGWGYTSASGKDEFVNEYRKVMEAIGKSTGLSGFCYTQITDVEQEMNGLLTYERVPKCDVNLIKEINDKIKYL